MALTLPAEATPLYGPQGAPDNVDFDAIVAGIGWNGVVSGCAVTAQGAPNMTVAVAAGTVAIGGVLVSVSAVASLAIGAHGAADRRDIVVVSNAGVVSVVAGTAAAAVNGVTPVGQRDPGKAAIPASSVILAEVYVAANTTSIVAGNIYDKFLTIPTTAPAGLTIPVGQSLVTGTRGVFSDTRAVTTNATDTVNVGTFSTTGGALELRFHTHLVAGVAGATASVTKVYEIAAGALMGTVSTWYLCLPADASANAATTNDFALEVQRTAAGTFQFRFRQKAIGLAGTITFTVENLGDTVVAFTKSTTVTAAPTAVTVQHPSNGLCVAAGNVGIGTESPLAAFHLAGLARVVGADSSSVLLTLTGGPSSTDARLAVNNSTSSGAALLAAITTAGTLTTDSAANDAVLACSTGQALRLGVISTVSTLQVSGSDVQINDNGTARSVPRGKVSPAVVINAITTMTTTETAITGAADISVTIVAGRRYRVMVEVPILSSVANDAISLRVRDGGGSAPTNASTLLTGGLKQFAGPTTSANNACYFFEIAPNALTAGTHHLGLFALRTAGSGTLSIGQTAAGWEGTVTVDDIGT